MEPPETVGPAVPKVHSGSWNVVLPVQARAASHHSLTSALASATEALAAEISKVEAAEEERAANPQSPSFAVTLESPSSAVLQTMHAARMAHLMHMAQMAYMTQLAQFVNLMHTAHMQNLATLDQLATKARAPGVDGRSSDRAHAHVERERERDAARKLQKLFFSISARRHRLHRHVRLAVELSKRGSKADGKLMENRYWIEAADPKHRYGSCLVPYYRRWLSTGSSDSFFHWLDEGEGRCLELKEMPRAALRKSRVKYLDADGRDKCEAFFSREKDGSVLLRWRFTGRRVDTVRRSWFCLYRFGGPEQYIFVVDFHYRLFIHKKRSGRFHHSSFLAGRPALAAGCVVVDRGRLLVVNGCSGHYKPSPRMLENVFARYERECGLRGDSFLMVHPRTRRICGLGCLPRIPQNFPGAYRTRCVDDAADAV